MGICTTASVQMSESMVCEATWPTLSPVISAWHLLFTATRSAMRIMKRRIIIVPISSGVFSCISICILVKGTMCSLKRPE